MARNKYPEVTINRIMDTSLKLFMEKGYEQTTIQDIIEALGDLSKGEIYHHFKSKEDIMEAVAEKLYSGTYQTIADIKNHTQYNGLEKIQQMFRISLENPNQEHLLNAAPNLMKNPRFLAEQLYTGKRDVTPMIQLFIEEGIRDGSIKAKYPKELSQVLILLSNIWLNPTIFYCTKEALYNKFIFLQDLTEKLGIPIGLVLLLPISAMGAFAIITLVTVIVLIFATMVSIVIITSIQQITPQEMTGKVMSLVMTVSMCASPIGQAVYGYLFDNVSELYWIIFGAVMILIFIVGSAKKVWNTSNTMV